MDLLSQLLSGGFSSGAFPSHLCVLKSPREKGVFDATEKFLCILTDKRFPTNARVAVYSPYLYKVRGEAVLYGWTDGPNIASHFEQSVHDDNEVVVAWKQV